MSDSVVAFTVVFSLVGFFYLFFINDFPISLVRDSFKHPLFSLFIGLRSFMGLLVYFLLIHFNNSHYFVHEFILQSFLSSCYSFTRFIYSLLYSSNIFYSFSSFASSLKHMFISFTHTLILSRIHFLIYSFNLLIRSYIRYSYTQFPLHSL